MITRFSIISFSEPKIGESSQNNQDCWDMNPEKGLIALADGAGSSLYPKQWADLLVHAFCQGEDIPLDSLKKSPQDWLKSPQQQWQQYYIQRLTDSRLKWWQKGSALRNYGAATFLGLHFNLLRQQWQAVALGDSCLFKLTAETEELRVFPNKTAQDFHSTSQCFISSPDIAPIQPQFTEGTYHKGDQFILATDALSQWILRNYEDLGQEWRKCFTLRETEDFRQMISQLRQNQLLKNDDTTLIIVTLHE